MVRVVGSAPAPGNEALLRTRRPRPPRALRILQGPHLWARLHQQRMSRQTHPPESDTDPGVPRYPRIVPNAPDPPIYH